MKKSAAIQAINKYGALLVYPIDNAPEPFSLWSVWKPKKKMVWEWTDSSDDSVADLWHLRMELSTSRKVIYSKWYRGRATFFSLDLFQALLHLRLKNKKTLIRNKEAREIYSILEERSPLSTKVLKRESQLIGRALEPLYQKALKELWQDFSIVGYGEVDDGAFPSLAIGSTRQLFEDLTLEAQSMNTDQALKILTEKFPLGSKWRRFYESTNL